MVAVLVAIAAALASAGQARAPSWPTWDYPYECWPYQASQYAYLNGTVYICEYVGPASSTGYAFVPQ